MFNRRGLLVIRLLWPCIHGLLILGLTRFLIQTRQYTDLIPFVQLKIPVIDIQETMLFGLLSSCVFFLIGLKNGLYELEKPIHSSLRKFLETRGLRMVVVCGIAFLGFGYVFESGISRFVLLMTGVLFFLVSLFVDPLFHRINQNIEKKNPFKVLILCDEEPLTCLLNSHFNHYEIYHLDNDITTTKRNYTSYDIILAAGQLSQRKLQSLADRAQLAGTEFRYVNDTHHLDDLISQPQRLGPIIAMRYIASPLEGRRRVSKRMFDLLGSSVLLICLSPVLVCVAFAIKIDSSGPALYRQLRVGKNGKNFMFTKFRSMFTHLSVGDEYGGKEARKLKQDLMDSPKNTREGILQKIEDDPRVTRVGSFLRKTSLDELPNLFNVFLGHMSLVGPRPHEPFEVEQYSSWHKRLLSIKPGMTGYAQLFGRDKLPFDEEVKLDLYYAQHWSLYMDVYVLISTIRVVLKGR